MLIVEIPYRDPFAAFQAFADAPQCAFLDSAAEGDVRARWSYIGADPYAFITSGADGVRLNGTRVRGTPLDVLARALNPGDLPPCLGPSSAPVPFLGGAMG